MQRRKKLLPPSRHAKQRRRKKIFYILAGIVVLAGIIWGISALSYNKAIAITEVKVSGAVAVDTKQVIEIAKKDLQTKYFYVISRNNSILYPRSKIKKDIMTQFPRVKDVNAAVESNSTLYIELSERKPFALWCKEITANDDCYFLDNQGFIFAKAPNFYGTVFFKYYNRINDQDPIGQTYMKADRLKAIHDFARQISQLGLVPVALKVRTLGEFDFLLEQGGRIMFSENDSFTQLLDNLSTLIGNQPALKDASNIDYIDLRFGNKLFYKLKTP